MRKQAIEVVGKSRAFSWANLCFALFLIPLCGCLHFHSPPHRDRGASLSDAMEASASGSKESISDHSSGYRYDSSVEVDANLSSSGGGDGNGFGLVVYDDREFAWQSLFDVSYSKTFNGDIDSLTRFTLTPISTEGEHNYLGLFVGGAIVELESGSLPDQAIDSSFWLETGLTYRYYLIDSHRFFSPYLTASAGFQGFFWHYRNDVYVDGESISGDSLLGGGGYLGFGTVIERNNRLNFFGEVGVGGTLFYDTTDEGFDNNVFDNFGYFSVKVGLSVKF